ALPVGVSVKTCWEAAGVVNEALSAREVSTTTSPVYGLFHKTVSCPPVTRPSTVPCGKTIFGLELARAPKAGRGRVPTEWPPWLARSCVVKVRRRSVEAAILITLGLTRVLVPGSGWVLLVFQAT